MKNKIAIVFNGPPGCGKDISAKHISNKLNEQHNGCAAHCEFKGHLRDIALLITGVDAEEWDSRYINRQLKDEPWDKCGGLSQRELYIKISEDWMKPLFGRDYFGSIVQQKISKLSFQYFVFSDGGFLNEILPLREVCDKVIYIRIHRPGTDYSSDSRRYVYFQEDEDIIIDYDVDNNREIKDLYENIYDVLGQQGIEL